MLQVETSTTILECGIGTGPVYPESISDFSAVKLRNIFIEGKSHKLILNCA